MSEEAKIARAEYLRGRDAFLTEEATLRRYSSLPSRHLVEGDDEGIWQLGGGRLGRPLGNNALLST